MIYAIGMLPILSICLFLSPAVAGSIRITPPPKELIYRGGVMQIADPTKAVIVIGQSASEPEIYAAERLQTLVRRRFNTEIQISRANEVPKESLVKIVLGLAPNNHLLAEICKRHGISMQSDNGLPKNDEYMLEVLDRERSIVILGSNERSVIFGAQTLFKLLMAENRELKVPVVSIRDWPSIAWRGGLGLNWATPDDLDAWLWCGFNYLRCSPDKNGDWETIRKAVLEAHKRGFFVYGCRSTAVSPPDFDKVIDDYRKFIDCGVDGLWISFDDAGPGVNTWPLMERIIALGRENGITGRKIAITPPAGDYNDIDTPFNRERVRIPGMEEATWFFTRVPCPGDMHTARSIGIKTLPAWWHNWPRVEGGLSNRWYGVGTLRPEGKLPYIEIPPLTWGWHHPNYEQIKRCAEYTDTILPCTRGNAMYRAAPLGIYAWDPLRHDFVATREAIYDATFGPDCVPLMLKYDDIHHLLKSYFTHPTGGPSVAERFPARLKETAERKDVEQLISTLESLAEEISRRAPAASILPEAVLETAFLEPMRAEPRIAQALCSLTFPEDWWPEYEGRLLELVAQGKSTSAKKLAEDKGSLLARQLSDIEKQLGSLLDLSKYLAFWRERANAHSAADLDKAVSLFHDRMGAVVGIDEVVEKCKSSECPGNWNVVDEVTPERMLPTIQRKNNWAAALYKKDEFSAIHMGFPAQKDSNGGDYCQVSFRMRVPQDGKRHVLGIVLAVSSPGSPNAGYDRKSGIRSLQILCDGKVIWEEDGLIVGQREEPWKLIDLSEISGEHEFSVRVIDRVAFNGYPIANWVGDSGETKGWTPIDADSYHMSVMVGPAQVLSASNDQSR